MFDPRLSADASSDDKLWAALCWIPAFTPWVALAILFVDEKRARPFLKYHAVHSLAVLAVLFLTSLILIGICLGAVTFFVMFYWAFLASQGKTFEIPLLSGFLRQQKWL